MPLPSAAGILRTAYRHPRYMEHLLISKLALRARHRLAESHPEKDGAVPLPMAYKLVLTYKCNLRCVMCYEWGEVGWCHDEPKGAIAQELDWGVIERVLAATASPPPYFILIGGEPLLFSRFGELARRLREERRFSIVCTNGLLIDRFDEALADNPYLTFLVSLDGPERENDLLRGQGVYRKVVANLRRLKTRARPPYVGIEFTIRPENVGTMYDFCKEMADLGVDWILLNPCWFVSEQQARDYEAFMQSHFGINPKSHLGYLMPYALDKNEFVDQMRRIRADSWPMQISCYLEKPEHVHTYVDTPAVPPGNTFCYRQWLRMDVTPTGEVTPCILYPDLIVGDLKRQDVAEIWNSPAFVNFRSLRRDEVLPVCAKCNALYLHDAKRKYL